MPYLSIEMHQLLLLEDYPHDTAFSPLTLNFLKEFTVRAY